MFSKCQSKTTWKRVCLFLGLFVLAPAAGWAEATTESTEATATLPLERVLEMQKQIATAEEEVSPKAPVAATVHRIELGARLLDEAVEFRIHYDIQVLDDKTWVQVPLLRRDLGTHLVELPIVAHGAFTEVDGVLHFITQKKRRYEFDLVVLKEATVSQAQRSVQLELAEASLSTCMVTFDEDLFQLRNRRALEKPEGVLIFPTEKGFEIDWTVREVEVAPVRQEKPEIASVVPTAYASSVSTLEGRRITRLLYQLRFAGHKAIEFEIPDEHRVDRAYLNGFAVPVEMQGPKLRILASPAQAGDESATVELVLMADDGVYHLAGDVKVALPKVSWPVHEIFVDLHLPTVFNYQWKSGSLSPVSKASMPSFTYQVPEPGKQMSFHQFLVTTHAPHMSLGYAVDLEGQYFCAQTKSANLSP